VPTCEEAGVNVNEYGCVTLAGRTSGSTIEGGYKCMDRITSAGDCDSDASTKALNALTQLKTNPLGDGNADCLGNSCSATAKGAANASVLQCSSAVRYKVSCVQQYQYRQITCK
jgi:hypothetical protein